MKMQCMKKIYSKIDVQIITVWYHTHLYLFCTSTIDTEKQVGYEYTQKYALARAEKQKTKKKKMVVTCKKFRRKLENWWNIRKWSEKKDSQLDETQNEHANCEGGAA